ncbi:MAG TPA: MFS transporter [Acidimicrobiales bacterium]|nr:MFS transporter [Acidimicrobiales bacterium]
MRWERLQHRLQAATPGSAAAALAHRPFLLVWGGGFASNVGTWMQNVALGVFAYQVSHSASFVALLGFAQMGPLLALAMVGGALGDAVDRKVLLIACQVEQMVMSVVLAWVAASPHPSRALLVGCVLAIGIGNALNAPTLTAVMPLLVGRRDLPGAVSLQSVQMNLSRVVGPAVGGLALPAIGASGIFAVNAVTYLFAVVTIALVAIPPADRGHGEAALTRLLGGVAVARRDPVVRRCLLTIAAISFFCLPFIGLMPVLAAHDLHVSPSNITYGLLYATFGLGAAIGAVSVGTVMVGWSRPHIVRAGLAAFAAALVVFGLVRSPAAAFPAVLLVGVSYFATVTALSTLLQSTIADRVRGRVMALWLMGFGGTVPLGLLAGGAVTGVTSIGTVVVGGGVVAAVLSAAWWRATALNGRRARAGTPLVGAGQRSDAVSAPAMVAVPMTSQTT